MCSGANNHLYLSLILQLLSITLANVSLQYLSSLKMIHLVTVVKTVDVATYGIDKILQPFMENIKELERVSWHVHVLVCNALCLLLRCRMRVLTLKLMG